MIRMPHNAAPQVAVLCPAAFQDIVGTGLPTFPDPWTPALPVTALPVTDSPGLVRGGSPPVGPAH